MPKQKSGPWCQIHYAGDRPEKRVVRFDARNPNGVPNRFRESVKFQMDATQAGVPGVLAIKSWTPDPATRDFVYPLFDIESDLHQLARLNKSRKGLPGQRLMEILRGVVDVLLTLQHSTLKRTHGNLGLESILLRVTSSNKTEVILTDFCTSPADPRECEKRDLLCFGKIIAAVASIDPEEFDLDSRALELNRLPRADDPEAIRRLGDRWWPALHPLATDLLSFEPRIQSLEQLKDELDRIAGADVKIAQAIDFAPLPDKSLADPPFPVAASTNSGLKVTFSVVSGQASIQGNLVTLLGPGVVTIKASQSGNERFRPAAEKVQSFKVRRSQTIQFERLPDKFLGDAPFPLNASSNSKLPVSFTLVSGPARIDGNIISLSGAGVVAVRASQPGNDDYAPAPDVSCSFQVKEREVPRLAQTIAFSQLGNKNFGDAPFRLNARSSAGLPLSFNVESGPAYASGDEVTLTGAGRVVVKAIQAGNTKYLPAEATQSFSVDRATQFISFRPLTDLCVGATVTIQAEASSGLLVSTQVVSGTCQSDGSRLRFVAAGPLTLKLSQLGDDRYKPAEKVVDLAVAKGMQTITFDPPGEICFGRTVSLGARANSGLPVKLALDSGPATLADNQLTLNGTGAVKIRATQTGDHNYNSAQEFLELAVRKAPQTIQFEELPDRSLAEPVFSLSAAATSGSEVAFRVVAGHAEIHGNEVTLTGGGAVEIEASQRGNENYAAAEPVVRSFHVADPRRKRRLILAGALCGLALGVGSVLAWYFCVLEPRWAKERHDAAVRQYSDAVKEGSQAEQQQQWAEAVTNFNNAITLAGKLDDSALEKSAQDDLGYPQAMASATTGYSDARTYYDAGSYDQALTAINTALTQCAEARNLGATGPVDGLQRQLDDLQSQVQDAEKKYKQYADALNAATNDLNIANTQLTNEEFHKALTTIRYGLTECDNARNLGARGPVDDLKGEFNALKSKVQYAEKNYEQYVTDLNEATNDLKSANTQLEKGNFNAALKKISGGLTECANAETLGPSADNLKGELNALQLKVQTAEKNRLQIVADLNDATNDLNQATTQFNQGNGNFDDALATISKGLTWCASARKLGATGPVQDLEDQMNSLKASIQQMADDETHAQKDFDQANYEQAGEICDKHPYVAFFQHLSIANDAESQELQREADSFKNGDYSFMTNAPYSSKLPFITLRDKAKPEADVFTKLMSLTNNPNKWQQVNGILKNESNQSFTNKPGFHPFFAWIHQNDPINQLNSQLEVFRIRFENKRNDDQIIDWDTRKVATKWPDDSIPDGLYSELETIKNGYIGLEGPNSSHVRECDVIKGKMDLWH